MARKKNKSLYGVALSFFLLGVGYLMFVGFSENSMPFVTVSEALAIPLEELKSARLFGTVGDRGFSQSIAPPSVRFQLEDKDDASNSLSVVYVGAVPDTFKPGAEVIVEGSFTDEAASFKAESLMTKCPSKYEKENRG